MASVSAEEPRTTRGELPGGKYYASVMQYTDHEGGQVDDSNRPVTSREYKLMLNVDRFRDRGQASQEFFGLLDFLIEKEGGSVEEEQNEEESRRTSYLDTPELALHQQGFALRLREEDDD